MLTPSSAKLLVVSALALLLLIPLTMVRSKLHERAAFQTQARLSVESSWTGAQTMLNPVLAVPYTLKPAMESGFVYVPGKVDLQRTLLLQPDQIHMEATVNTKYLDKGIYRVPVYSSELRLRGTFLDSEQREKLRAVLRDPGVDRIGVPYIAFHISDVRGLEAEPELIWNGVPLPLQPGSALDNLSSGVHGELPSFLDDNDASEFTLQVALRGTDSLSFITVAKESTTQVASPWPHPEFIGDLLPANRNIGPDGFEASWFTSRYVHNGERMMTRCVGSGQCQALRASSHGVRFIEPVDVYLQSERAIKYALLFIGLSFIAFFIFEHLKNIRIHPVQYSFVGLAIAVFYLLLLSLSEHMVFASAYLISAASCSGLLFSYLRHVLRSTRAAFVFLVMIAALYGVLYVILQAEDYALLMGAVLVFAILAALMTITRKIDWYDAAGTQP